VTSLVPSSTAVMKSTTNTIIAACLASTVLAQEIYGPTFTCRRSEGAQSESSKGKKGSSPVGDWRINFHIQGDAGAETCKPGKATLGEKFVEEGDCPIMFETKFDCEDYITYLWCVCGAPDALSMDARVTTDAITNTQAPMLAIDDPSTEVPKATVDDTATEVPKATADDTATEVTADDTATEVPKATADDIATEVPKATADDTATEVPKATADDTATEVPKATADDSATEVPKATADDTTATEISSRVRARRGHSGTSPQSQCYDPRHRGGKGGKSLGMHMDASTEAVASVSGAVAGVGFVVAVAVFAIKRRSRATASAEDTAAEATEQTPILADTLVIIA
jgi:hypothetical protein